MTTPPEKPSSSDRALDGKDLAKQIPDEKPLLEQPLTFPEVDINSLTQQILHDLNLNPVPQSGSEPISSSSESVQVSPDLVMHLAKDVASNISAINQHQTGKTIDHRVNSTVTQGSATNPMDFVDRSPHPLIDGSAMNQILGKSAPADDFDIPMHSTTLPSDLLDKLASGFGLHTPSSDLSSIIDKDEHPVMHSLFKQVEMDTSPENSIPEVSEPDRTSIHARRMGIQSTQANPLPDLIDQDLMEPNQTNIFSSEQPEIDDYTNKISSGFIISGIPVAIGTDEVNVNDLHGGLYFDPHLFRKDFPILKRKVNGKPLIWMDNGATTQKPQQVIDALAQYYAEYNSNIHRGAHTLAAEATDAYEEAREKVQRFIGAQDKKEIIFVRGTTEAINLVAQTFGRQNIEKDDEIIVSELEHHSNIVPWQMLAKERGAKLRIARVNSLGEIDLGEYEQLFTPRTRIVAVTHASNAIGTVPPIKEMVEIAHRHDVPVLVDGAQSIPHMPVNVTDLDVDFYVFSGHKIFGPMGVGVLYGKAEILQSMPPWQGGGSMIKDVEFDKTEFNDIPEKFEAGTPNVAGPIGLGVALDYLSNIGMEQIEKYEHQLLVYATKRLKTVPRLKLIGEPRMKIGVLSFVIDDIPPEEIGKRLDSEGIAVRVGHHCAQPILRRFGFEVVVRPSLAFYNTREEIDRLVEVLCKFVDEWIGAH